MNYTGKSNTLCVVHTAEVVPQFYFNIEAVIEVDYYQMLSTYMRSNVQEVTRSSGF